MNIVEIIYLVAIAFAFASVLLIQIRIKTEQKLLLAYLSGYLFILGISNLMLLLLLTGWMAQFPYLFKLFMPLSLLSTVIAYWYVEGSLGKPYVPKGWRWLHLVPFILVTLHYLPFYFSSIEVKSAIVKAVIANNEVAVSYRYGWLFTETQVLLLRTVQSIIYLLLMWISLKKFEKAQDVINKRSEIILSWLKFLTRAMSIYLMAVIGCYIIFGLRFNGADANNLVEGIVFLFTAALVLILSSYLLLNPKAALSIDRPVDVFNPTAMANFDQLRSLVKNNRWYTNQQLTQPQLLELLALKPSEFTLSLKLAGFSNFYEFVNSIRLECFIEKATPDELQRNSIEGIASACGFKSPATFYRVFKEKYGTTPKRFLESLHKP